MEAADARGDLEFAKVRIIAAIDRLLTRGILSEPQADSLLDLLEEMTEMGLDELKARLEVLLESGH